MRIGTVLFRLLLGVGWVALSIASVHAAQSLGLGAAGSAFFQGFAQPWTAQFNIDFGLHLLLVAAWMIYRSRSWVIGLICAILAINLGGLFTLAYLFVVSIQAQGDFRKVLSGARGTPGN
jgi:hypothetical protein